MIAVAIKLSQADVGDYWDDADRWIRNQFAENQMLSAAWVARLPRNHWPRPPKSDETVDRVGKRNVGTFFGWPTANDSSPTGNGHMHCCTGNAARTLYYIWESIVEARPGRVRVHLPLNCASKSVDVESHVPYTGRVDVRVKTAIADLFLRVPEWVASGSADLTVFADGKPASIRWEGRYVSIGTARAGQVFGMRFPPTERTLTRRVYGAPVETVIGGVVYDSLTFRGNDVVDVQPPGKMCPLYQRGYYGCGYTRWRKAERFVPDKEITW
jgi:hypothetical protein